MAWRKWLVRGLVFSVVGVTVLAALLYEAWTNPAAVRSQVLAKLAKQFIGATVNVDSARLRLLGGIAIHDLRMARRDQLDRADFLYVPSALISLDKEHLLDGTLGIRKVELDRPRLRVVRQRDGQLNLSGLLAEPDLKERVPTLLIRHGTIQIEDHSLPSGGAVLEIKDVQLSVINDPLSTLVVEGTGRADEVGAVHIHARVHRATGAVGAALELPEVPVGPALVQRLAAFCPDFAAHVRQLSGLGKVQAALAHRPGDVQPWTYDVRCQLTEGKWCHARLPEPLEQIEASLRCVNGHVPEARVTARLGPAKLDLTLRDLVLSGHAPASIEDAAREWDARVEHLVVTPKFFDRLPKTCQNLRRLYSPTGPVSLTYRYRRIGTDQWHKNWEVRPEGMSAEFELFRYPVDAVTGSVQVDLRHDGDNHIAVNLSGRCAGQPITVKGDIRGDKANEVDMIVASDNIPVDHKLLLALPKKSRELARKFLPARSRELGLPSPSLGQLQPAGLADIKVFIRRARGHREFANRYLIAFHDASVRPDLFPISLEKVTGILDIQPDHWECRDFHGIYKGGEIRVNGRSFRASGADARPPVVASGAPAGGGTIPADPRAQQEFVQIAVNGRGIVLDSEFEQALSPPDAPGRAALRNAWEMLSLQGRLNFDAVVVDRPDHPEDIKVAVDVRGCAMQPGFFRYLMTDVGAAVRYAHGRVDVKNVRAKHGACLLGLNEATILLKPAGGFQAWFKGIRGNQLVPDKEFLRALHPSLRKGLEPLQLRHPIDVETSLVLDAPAGGGQPMKIWWDGGALLRKQLFQTGLEVSGVDGEIWCSGHYNGRQLEGVGGYAVLEQANILGQPFRHLQGRIEVSPEAPDVLRLYDLKADLFGGFVGGAARFEFGPTLRYEVKLDALHVQLDQFGKHNNLGSDAQLQGPARASLHLMGEGTDLSGLKGNGRIEVPNGKLYRLPLLLNLLKAFGLRRPDRTAFEQARMIFAIKGPQMQIQQIDLIGNAISLRGQGTVDLNGSNLNLDFNADWGRMPQMLPSVMSDLSQTLSDQLFKIKMRGAISAPRFEPELMPGVVDPLKKVLKGS